MIFVLLRALKDSLKDLGNFCQIFCGAWLIKLILGPDHHSDQLLRKKIRNQNT